MIEMEHEKSPLQGSRLMPRRSKKLFVRTYGCQMNVYDSQRMADALAPVGYATTDEIEQADVMVLNTCHIREKASEKVYSELGRIRKIKDQRKREGKKTIVIVAGCVAQAEGKEILRRAPVVDLVIGPQSYHKLPDLIFRAAQENCRTVDTDFPEEDKFQHLPQGIDQLAPSAFLTVQEGCDKFCTFCVVPYTRGAEFSRSVKEILTEARQMIERGVREITLLGQNVNAYHGTGQAGNAATLAQLLRDVSALDGLERLRYTTSHPRDMSDDLIEAHATIPKLMPYLHLPFQAGSDRILAAMNRQHTALSYIETIQLVRNARPDIALSTDIIVGFPGETDDEFEQTLDVVRAVNFAQAYSFKYSPRPGTPAAILEEQIPEEVKAQRLRALQNLLNEQQGAFNEGCIGINMPVLFERRGNRENQILGRSPYLQSVHVDGAADLIGNIVNVEISSAGPNSLSGVIKSAPIDAISSQIGV